MQLVIGSTYQSSCGFGRMTYIGETPDIDGYLPTFRKQDGGLKAYSYDKLASVLVEFAVPVASSAEQLIACLEGEIAKRDAIIYDERIDADLQRQELDAANANLAGLRDELAATKAQEPVAYIPVDRETGEEWHPVLKKGSGKICDYKPLYADPVPEAKAQGVVMLADTRHNRVYLAGPMTGIEDYNFTAFNAEAARLRETGLHVENPAEHGIVDGADWADYLRYDIGRLATCEKIHLLPGWSKSKGAKLELQIAQALCMHIWYAEGAEEVAHVQQEQPFCEYCGGNDEEPQDHCMDCTRPVQQVSVPDGYVLVPQRMELAPADIASIMFHCGGDEEATEVDEMFVGGVLWVGDIKDDDDNLVHGLHIATADYPEEGSTTLVEFAAAPAAPAADAWIQVSERLPEPNTKVLVHGPKCKHFFALRKNRQRNFWEFLDGNTCNEKITHWMPLPAAPSAHRAKGVL